MKNVVFIALVFCGMLLWFESVGKDVEDFGSPLTKGPAVAFSNKAPNNLVGLTLSLGTILSEFTVLSLFFSMMKSTSNN